MNVVIVRAPSTPLGTFGMFIIDGDPLCVTCELPDKDNAPDVSCIPKGTYTFTRHVSAKFPKGNTWEAQNVQGRTGILLHNANDVAELEGCIAVGASFGTVAGLPAVLDSNATLDMLNTRLPDVFTLTIE